MQGKVAVAGVGCTKFGELHDRSYASLAYEAAAQALGDAGMRWEDIDGCWLGTALPDAGSWEGHAGDSLVDALPHLSGIPVTRVGNWCATGMDAFRNACYAVASGACRAALVVGCEKMRDTAARNSLIAQVAEHGPPLLNKGLTAPGMFALRAVRYMHEFGVERTTLAKVAVKNHANGARNPLAHFRREVTVEEVLSAPWVAYPFGLLDCTPQTDGAAAAVIVRSEDAPPDAVRVLGIGLSVTYGTFIHFYSDYDFLGFPATREAARRAYEEAGIRHPAEEIDVAEVHDCFTMTEILNYEDLGFAPRGEGWKLIEEGVTSLEGRLPVNPSGGLKSFGHPIGASGVRMIYEITQQLRGRSGERQVRGAQVGLAHNLGGSGTVAAVVVLARRG